MITFQHVAVRHDDPYKIDPSIAPVDPPTTRDLVEKGKSILSVWDKPGKSTN